MACPTLDTKRGWGIFLPAGCRKSWTPARGSATDRGDMNQNTLKLEVGKRYVTRDGQVTGPVDTDELHTTTTFPFHAVVDGVSEIFRADGTWSWVDGTEDDMDLVSEYGEPTRSIADTAARPDIGLADAWGLAMKLADTLLHQSKYLGRKERVILDQIPDHGIRNIVPVDLDSHIHIA